MNIDLERIEEKLEIKIRAAFITGSYVNGWYREGKSDVDVTVVTDTIYTGKNQCNVYSNISANIIPSESGEDYKIGKYHFILNYLPLQNQDYIDTEAGKIRAEMLRREVKKLGEKSFSPEDLVFNHYRWEWGICQPWRLKHLDKMLSSSHTKDLFRKIYLPYCQEAVKTGLLLEVGERFKINLRAVFNDDGDDDFLPENPSWQTFKKSKGGLLYILNAPRIFREWQTITGKSFN